MPKETEYDVCIIGSGAGGAPTAYALGKAGFKTIVLEAGRRFKPEEYHLNKKEWENYPYPQPFADFKNRSKERYTSVPTEKLNLKYNHLRSKAKYRGQYNRSNNRMRPFVQRAKGVGGTTLHYQAEAQRFSDYGFKTNTLFGFGADWPITYKDLEPYYDKAEKILKVSGNTGNPDKPPRIPFPQPAHELSCASKRVKVGFDKLGLNLLPNTLNILSKPADGRPACNYCNGCFLGCMITAKGSMDVTMIPKAEATKNVVVQPNSVVSEITVNDKGKADGVIYFDDNKTEHRIRSQIVIVSGGALETPRLLLNSKSSQFPDGLANSSGLVGKNFMETVVYINTVIYEEDIESYKGLQIDSRCYDYNRTSKDRNFSGGVVFGLSAMDLLGPLGYARTIAPTWGEDHVKFMKDYFGHAVNIFAIGEMIPRETNTITIDSSKKDYYGIPVAKIKTRMSTNDLEMISFMQKITNQIISASGAKESVREMSSYDLSLISHIGGTTIMGTDPKISVLNPFSQSHDVKNLFVCDASPFVSQGGGDSPSLTIHALAFRASDYIITEAKKGNN